MILKKLWRDQRGVINTVDLILTTTILVLGMIVGLVMLRNQVVEEFADTATAIGNLNQGYSLTGQTIGEHSVAGSSYTDETNVGVGEVDFTSPTAVLGNSVPGEN